MDALRERASALRDVVPVVPLHDVRRRLELQLAALYGTPIRIEALPPDARPDAVQRMVDRVRPLPAPEPSAATDGVRILLPPEIVEPAGAAIAIDAYRLLALGQAERIRRGTIALVPGNDDPLVRDLYLLRESGAVDAVLDRPGSAHALARARATALATLARRRRIVRRTRLEDAMDVLVQTYLERTIAGLDATTATDSLAWARESASRMRTIGGEYHDMLPVAHWGRILPAPPRTVTTTGADADADDGDDARAKLGIKHGIVEVVAEEMDPKEKGPAPEPDTQSHGRASEDAASDDDPDAVAAIDPNGMMDGEHGRRVREGRPMSGALSTDVYAEWDCYARRYRPDCVTVRSYRAPEGDPAWAASVLHEHGSLARSIRAEFERLRSRRLRLHRQRDGDELDMPAVIDALVQRQMGESPDDRLFISTRAGRRPLAIAILVDTSGSTRDPVAGGAPVIDIERIALLLASEALGALGDRFAILTFSSHGEGDVRVTCLKDFEDRAVDDVRSRIAAIAPGGKTRLGAAIRHATALLVRQPVAHRLLLILSDGKPNDTDRYFERYGVEDTRAAVLEARATAVYPFCITVDTDEPESYVEHIFGVAGHTILRRPDQLPKALLAAVQLLLTG